MTWTVDDKQRAQTILIQQGFDIGPFGADGVLGEDTKKALIAFQQRERLNVNGVLDTPTITRLFSFERKTKMVGNNWLSGIVASTAFKYVVALIAGFIAAKLGVEKGSVEGVLTEIVGVLMGVWGMYESSKSKVVVNGQSVQVKHLDPAAQKEVVAAVADAKGTTPAAVLNK